MRSPFGWFCESEELGPVREGREDFEGFGKGSGFVSGEEEAYSVAGVSWARMWGR